MQNLKEVLARNDFKFNKRFGQNFISDENLLNAICNDAGVTKNCEVLEIGTGAGTLTSALCESVKKVVSYEIDKKLIPVHNEVLSGYENLEIVYNDILKEDLDTIRSKFSSPIFLVANLPYYITTPIIFKFIESDLDIDSLTIMVQKEVAQRLVAKSGTKEYGSITIMLNAIGDVSIKRIVTRDNFTPSPDVDSAIINLKFNKKYDIRDKKKFSNTVRACFYARRKTLVNNLCNYFGISKVEAQKAIASAGLEPNIRGEKLNVEDVIKLSELIK